jgi:hypothetical protein
MNVRCITNSGLKPELIPLQITVNILLIIVVIIIIICRAFYQI